LLDSGGLLTLLGIPLAFLAIGLILLLGRCLKKKDSCFTKVMNKVKEKVCFNMLIRTVLTSYLPLAISSGLGRQLANDPDEVTRKFSIIAFLLTWLGLVYFFSIWVDVDELDFITVKDKFSNFYIELLWEKEHCMSYVWTFLVHRLCFVLCMQIDIMSLRIWVFLYIQVVWMEYLNRARPWYDIGVLYRELFN
jgi:hypothetical protein